MRKFIQCIILLCVYSTAFGDAAVFNGDSVKILKQNLSMNGVVSILSGSTDPIAASQTANAGSLYLRTNGASYLKQDSGHTNNWKLIPGPITQGSLLASGPVSITGGSNVLVGTSATVTMTQAGVGTDGWLSTTDWNTFNNKLSSVATATLSASSPINVTGGVGAVLSAASLTINLATTATSGYLSNTDWNTFNGKEPALTKGNLSGTANRLTVTNGTNAVLGTGASLNIDTGLLPSPLVAGKYLHSTGSGTAQWDDVTGGAGVIWANYTADASMTINNGYIASKTATGSQVFSLPATCSTGDSLEIIGNNTVGWTIKSNASAATQTLVAGNASSPTSSSSAISLYLASAGIENARLVCTATNTRWMMEFSTGGAVAGSNYYGTGGDGDFTYSSNTSLTSTTDGDMVVMNYNNLTINSGVTLNALYRNKGLLIYVKGNAIINGTLSASARGGNVDAAAAGVGSSGLAIRRFVTGQTDTNSASNLLAGAGTAAIAAENNQAAISSNGKVWYFTRSGATGASYTATNGATGTAGTAGQSGGGGSGGSYDISDHGGNGSAGTCFSGGTGGGGVWDVKNASDGAVNGGAGGNANQTSSNPAGGGAGNPGGLGISGGSNGGDGTGGLIILIVKGNLTIGASGIIASNGVAGGSTGSGGGGSGGGNILVLYAGTLTNSGSITANGGAASTGANRTGGAGGAGSIQGPTRINI